jgi:hypothetical protein
MILYFLDDAEDPGGRLASLLAARQRGKIVMTSLIEKAGAWCNGEVAYLAWQVAKKIDG